MEQFSGHSRAFAHMTHTVVTTWTSPVQAQVRHNPSTGKGGEQSHSHLHVWSSWKGRVGFL